MAPRDCPACENGVINDAVGGDCSNGCRIEEQGFAEGLYGDGDSDDD